MVKIDWVNALESRYTHSWLSFPASARSASEGCVRRGKFLRVLGHCLKKSEIVTEPDGRNEEIAFCLSCVNISVLLSCVCLRMLVEGSGQPSLPVATPLEPPLPSAYNLNSGSILIIQGSRIQQSLTA